MTKKTLFSLLLVALASMAATAQTQVAEHVRSLAGMAKATTTATLQSSTAGNDAAAVKEIEAKMAQSRAVNAPAATATATAETVKAERKLRALGSPQGSYAPGTWQVSNKAPKRTGAKAKALASINYAAEFDTKYSDGSVSIPGVITVKRTDDTHAEVYNLWGLTDTLQATYDETAGTLSVAPGKIYNHSTYGAVWACSMNLSSKTYSTTNPIVGTIGDDGVITFSPWGVLVVEGQYKGGSFGIYSKSEFKPTNATVSEVNYNGKSVTVTDSVRTYPVYIEQTYDNMVQIVNFTNNGAVVNMRLKPDHTATISPQTIFTNALYGPFKCRPADWAKSKTAQKGYIVSNGQGTDTQIAFGNWGVFCDASQSMRSLACLSSTITFDKGVITYPSASSFEPTGDGTEASPYVITTASQLSAFCDDVNGGNDYKGKYVALGNDIDMSQSTSAFIGAGTADAPFRGTFDGKSYTISNLNIIAGEESYQGLFGYADSTSVLKNVKLANPVLNVAGNYSAPLAGWCSGAVSGITVTGASLTYANHTGAGVVGYLLNNEITDCEFTGSITGAGENAGVVGDLVGRAKGYNLKAHGSITMSSTANTIYKSVGGVVASTLPSKDAEPVLSHSYSDMQLTDKTGNAYMGGVVGQVLTGTVECCFNAGPISGAATTTTSKSTGSVGGVAGNVYGGNLADCYNANIVINSNYSTQVGGVVGYVPSPSYTSDSQGNIIAWSYLSSVKRCLNLGQVRMSQVNETMGAYGAAYSDTIFTNVYYDKQVVGTIAPASISRMALSTAQLTTGNALEGFDWKLWTYTSGLYPRLKAMASNAAAFCGAAPMTFADGDNVTKVRRTFKISTDNDIYWKLYGNSSFVDETDGLKIAGDSVTVKDTYSSEVIVAMSKTDKNQLKMYSLSTINPSLFEGAGTEANPYLIKSVTDLESLNQGISTYGQTFKGDFFKQVNDIDASGFGGIGMGANSALQLNATYDGGGHTIHNLKISGVVNDADGKADSKQSMNAVALFGFIGKQGTVKNLTIASDCEITGYDYASGVAAVNYGTVTNCKNLANITAVDKYAAGVVALNQAGAVIDNCYNSGHIVTGGSYAAGISAYSLGTVTYCQNDGYILGDSINPLHKAGTQINVAGIVATNGAPSVIKGNINAGAVYATRTVGGITTTAPMNGSVVANINYGTVERATTTDVARGAVFSAAPSSSYDVANNYYDAQICHYGAAASSVIAGAKGVNTSVLTSGSALDDVVADKYDWTAGLYPVIKSFKDEAGAKANRKMVVTFAEGQTADDVVTDAPLYQADDLQWSVKGAKNFSVGNGKLSINLTPDTTSLRDVLVAKVGNFEKEIALRAMPSVFEGQGTAESPFLIKTKDDMLKLAKFTNEELYPFSGRYFRVENDIDFDTTTYVCVGIGSGSFNGFFDGAQHQFSNINNVYASTASSQGLFGNVGPQAHVHSLTLASGKISGYRYVGAIAGNVYGRVSDCVNKANVYTDNSGAAGIAGTVKTGGLVYNCSNEGTVESKGSYLGGIAYKVEPGATVDSCRNIANITSAKGGVGGIAVYSQGTIIRCNNDGKITATGTVGGILAQSQGGDTIAYCNNYGTINVTGNNVGGIVGSGTKSLEPLTIIDCHNEASVTGKGYLGGVAGRLYPGSVLESCSNIGNVTSVSSTNIGGVAGQHDYAAGYESKMTNCYNTGDVVGTGKYIGGVVGNNYSGCQYYYCYNTGSVLSGADFAGGFSGGHSGYAFGCYNAGSVEANGYGIGGFSGLGSGTIEQCFNVGSVTSTNGTNKYGVAGGLWGYGRPTLRDSYNMGDVSGQKYVGGIAGGAFTGMVLENVYNAGHVATSDTTTSGLIIPVTTAIDEITFTNVSYDTDVNSGFTPSSSDASAKGLSTRELTLLDMGAVWNKKSGMYPTLALMDTSALANYFAAVPVFKEGETSQSVRSAFVVGTPDGTDWTMSDNLFMSDGKVDSNAEGWAWITKTFGNYSRKYVLYVEKATGVDGINSDAAIVKTEYYTVGGVALGGQCPTETGVYVVKDFYNNGKSASRKMIVR